MYYTYNTIDNSTLYEVTYFICSDEGKIVVEVLDFIDILISNLDENLVLL